MGIYWLLTAVDEFEVDRHQRPGPIDEQIVRSHVDRVRNLARRGIA